MVAERKRRAPAGLGKAGRRLWRSVSDGLVLRADELAVLEAAARTADQVATLEAAVAASPPMIPGSRGQSILHPAIAELRLQRQLLSSLLGRLDVPEEEAGFASAWDGLSSSQRARRAARARWGKVA
jgi:hypothetical protein